MPISEYFSGHGDEVASNMQKEYGDKWKPYFYGLANKRKNAKPAFLGDLGDPQEDDPSPMPPPPPPRPPGPMSQFDGNQGDMGGMPPQPMAGPPPMPPSAPAEPPPAPAPVVNTGMPPSPTDIGANPMYRRGMIAQIEKADEGNGAGLTSSQKQSQIGQDPVSQEASKAAMVYAAAASKKTPAWKEALGITLGTLGLGQVGSKLTGDDEKAKTFQTAKNLATLSDEQRKQITGREQSDLHAEQIQATRAWREEAIAGKLAALKPAATPKERYLQTLEIPGIDEATRIQYALNPTGVKQDKPEAFGTVPAGGSVFNKGTGSITGTAPAAPPKPPTDLFDRWFLPNFAKKLGKVTATGEGDPSKLSPQENEQAHNEYKQNPELTASTLASRAMMDAIRQLQLNQEPTRESAKMVAQDIIAHRLGPEQLSTMFGGFGKSGQTFKRMVYEEGKGIDPEFNYEQASAEYQLAKSPGFQNTIRYMDSARSSIPQVISAAQALANGNIKSLNSLINAGKEQFNNINLRKFNTDRTLVADEIAKILAGGGTGNQTSDAKMQQAMGLIKESDDPALVVATLSEVNKLLGFRRSTLTRGTYMEHQGETPAHQGPTGPIGPASSGADEYLKKKGLIK